jgi:heme exporter protein D
MLECVLDVGFAFNYASWILVAAAMGFIALIIRVIKNVFCQAYLLKEENDFTI